MIQQFYFWAYTQMMRSLFWRNILTPMFIASLFTTAKTWKQPRYMKTHTHTHPHTVEYTIQPYKGNPAICDNKDGSLEHYSK